MNHSKGFISPLLLALIALLLLGGGAYVYAQKNQTNQSATATSTAPTTNQVQQMDKTSQQASGRGSGGIVIPTVNDFPASDFKIASPSNGETWSKGDSSKNISWTYPAELKGRNIQLSVWLVNLDLIKKGRSSGDPDVSLGIYSGSTNVPNSGKGEVAWDFLRATPEGPFGGYSGNSRVLISVNDSNSLKVYNAVSDPFVVSPTIVTSTPIVPIEITSPQTNAVYKIGDTLDVKWTGSTHASDICDISLVGPLDQNGEVIQALGAIVSMGGPLCSSGTFSWKISSSYLHGGYNYNMMIRSPYGSYSKTIMITQ